jgi:flagellar biosynthetic protein FlhB
MDEEEKTEDPTPKRISEARQKGQVAKSQDLIQAVILIAVLWIFYIYGNSFFNKLTYATQVILSHSAHWEPTVDSCTYYYLLGIKYLIDLLWPILLTVLAVGIAFNCLQVGLLFTLEPLEPNPSKLNPISGIKRMFSLRSIVELLKSMIKLTVVGLVAYIVLKKNYSLFLEFGDYTIYQIVKAMASITFEVGIKIAIALLIMAIFDFYYQRYEHNKSLKMSKHEIKEERRQMEGDPEVKARIKRLQVEMARRRMMHEVPKATVVITNPTHIAIALKYEPAAMKAPLVVAKGKRKVAEQIKKIAQENNSPIVEDKPLARALFDAAEVGEEIPYNFFKAVAEILAYVYRLKGKVAA